jgi:hypothetical protein
MGPQVQAVHRKVAQVVAAAEVLEAAAAEVLEAAAAEALEAAAAVTKREPKERTMLLAGCEPT